MFADLQKSFFMKIASSYLRLVIAGPVLVFSLPERSP